MLQFVTHLIPLLAINHSPREHDQYNPLGVSPRIYLKKQNLRLLEVMVQDPPPNHLSFKDKLVQPSETEVKKLIIVLAHINFGHRFKRLEKKVFQKLN